MFEDALTYIHGGGVTFGLDYAAHQTIPHSVGRENTIESPVTGVALVKGTVTNKKIDYVNKISIFIGSLAVYSGSVVPGDNTIPIYVSKGNVISLETDATTVLKSVAVDFIPYLPPQES